MGTWGTGLYANDSTCDVRDTYKKFLEEQLSDEEAYYKTLEEFQEFIGDEKEPFLWYALADTQWRLGRLMPEVKDKAMEWISKKGGIELWEESANKGAGWEKTLHKLAAKIESPMPPRKTIRKPVEFVRNPWNTGDVYVYQFHTEIAKERGLFGKFIPFQKIGNTEWCDGWILSVIQVYDCVFDTVPTLKDIEKARILPLAYPPGIESAPTHIKDYVPSFEWYMKAYMIYEKKVHYPQKSFTYVGHQPVSEWDCASNELTHFFWEKDGMEEWLVDYYFHWKNIEY